VADESVPPRASAGRKALTGTFVALWALADAPVGLVVVTLAALLNALIVCLVAAFVLSIVNIFCCTWLNREWDGWAAGPGKRLETRVQKLRASKRMKRPVAWVTRGSTGWYVAAACLTNAVQATALARVIGGQSVDARRLRLGAIGFSIFVAILFSLIGLAARDIITAL
jgi:hypothetical protein